MIDHIPEISLVSFIALLIIAIVDTVRWWKKHPGRPLCDNIREAKRKNPQVTVLFDSNLLIAMTIPKSTPAWVMDHFSKNSTLFSEMDSPPHKVIAPIIISDKFRPRRSAKEKLEIPLPAFHECYAR
ncbi:MAG: hypothetical protein WDN28_13825 [Chthoniobacter sp.]